MNWVSENIDLLALLTTYLGFGLAIFTYVKAEREKAIHVLLVLYKQLEAIGPWCSSENDGYYSLTQKQKFNYYWPFYIIFDIANTPLLNLSNLSGYIGLSENTIGKINELNQNISRIKSIENFRYNLVTSNYELAKSIDQKMGDYLTKNAESPIFEEFEKSLPDEEKHLIKKLKEWGNDVHLVRIGNINSNASRYQWGSIHKDVINRLCKLTETDKGFLIITSLYLLTLLFVLLQLLGRNIDLLDVTLISALSILTAYLMELNFWRFYPDRKSDYCRDN